MEKEATPRRNLYIIGAQCTGKTTLVNALEDEFSRGSDANTVDRDAKPSIIRELARRVLQEKNFSREDITTSPSRALQLQKHILNAQLEAEKVASPDDAPARWCICDRSGLDPIAYARVFVSKETADEMLETEAWRVLEGHMKAGIVILCEAGVSWLIDDGTRLMPDGIEDWMRLDDAFRMLLAERGINYAVVTKDMVGLAERVEFVMEKLRPFRVKEHTGTVAR